MKLKKLLKSLNLLIVICVIMSAFSLNATAFYELTYRHEYKGIYENVKINDIYYYLSINGNKDDEFSIYATYPVVRGDTLKIPDKISFKGREYKVNNVTFDVQEEYNENFELPSTIVLPYKTIYLPKFANYLLISSGTKLPNLEKIYIPKKISDLSSLSDMPKLKVIIDKKNPYIKMKNGAVYSKNGKKLLTLVNSKKKYKISEGTEYIEFGGQNNTVEKVILPSSLKKLNFDAFSRCNKLKSVKFNKELKFIAAGAFDKCTSLKSISLPINLEKIAYSAFSNCRSLEEITIPKNIKKIQFFTFGNCTELSRVEIANEEKSPKIEDTAFQNTAEGIEFIVKNQTVADQLKEQLTSNKRGVRNAKILIGDKVVYENINCKSKKCQRAYDIITTQNGIKYKLRSSGTIWSDGELSKSHKITDIFLKAKTIKFPNTVVYRNKTYEIDSVWFSGNRNPYKTPESAKTCEKIIVNNMNYFSGIYKWNKLKEIKATNIKDGFENIVSCNKLKKIYISGDDDCTTYIGNISQNNSLNKIFAKDFGDLGRDGITDCKKLRTIVLSGKVGKIQRNAISKCNNLKKIKIQAENKVKIQKNAFNNVPENCKIFVKNKATKKAVKESGFKGNVIVMK